MKKGKDILTIDRAIKLYELNNEVEGKSPRTIEWYNYILNQFSSYIRENQKCSDISAFNRDIVREYILYLRNKPKFYNHPYIPCTGKQISPRTVQCHVRALKAFSTWLYLEGHNRDNMLQNLKLPKAPSKIIEPLTPEEIKGILSCLQGNSFIKTRNHAILVTLLDTGLRVSEAANMGLNNVNMVDGYVKVMGKGSKERLVPLGKYAQMILLNYINKVRSRLNNTEDDGVFLSTNGRPISSNTIKLSLSRLARTSGVTRLHAHLCRHTFAINYLLNGGDIFSLKEILGHTSLDMVNHYLHFTGAQITAMHHKYSPMDKFHNNNTGK